MKKIVKYFFALFGLKIQRIDTPTRSLDRGLKHLSRFVHASMVIDIGVANGTPELYRAFPAKEHRYLLVEADPRHAAVLARLEWELGAEVFPVFCGREAGVIPFNSAIHNAEYSSAYALRGLQTKTVEVPVRTLDAIVAEARPGSHDGIVLKIDVEGAEMEVLRGAVNVLHDSVAVIVETSVAVKHVDGAEFADVVTFMRDRGFSVFDMLAGANREGNLYQLDVVFVRSDAKFRQVLSNTTICAV